MNICRKEIFGRVEGYMFGFGPLGPPLMSVYLYYIDGVLIDTAQSHMRRSILKTLYDKPIRHILLTHHHEDHSGNAAYLKQKFNARVWGHPLTAAKMQTGYKILPYQHYVWGKTTPLKITPLETPIETSRLCFTPIHTPGHSKDHTVYLEENNGWLFSGDLYLGDRIKFFRSDEKILDQIQSLKTVLKLNFDALLCGHRPFAHNGRQRVQQKLTFLEDFYGNVTNLVGKGYSEKEIIRQTSDGSDRHVKWITLGNASHANMVRSAINAIAT